VPPLPKPQASNRFYPRQQFLEDLTGQVRITLNCGPIEALGFKVYILLKYEAEAD